MAPSVNLCLEPACLQASAHVLLNMATDYKRFDPCTQFEEMICPGFRVNNPKDTFGLVRANSATIAIEKILMDMSYEEAINYTSSAPPTEEFRVADRANFEKMTKGYHACMNEGKRTQLGVDPLRDFAANITKRFQVNDTASTLKQGETDGVQDAIGYLESHGIPTFLDYAFLDDPQNKTHGILVANVASPTVPINFTDPNAVLQYLTTINGLFEAVVSLGRTKTQRMTHRLAHSIVQFEAGLTAIFEKEDVKKELERQDNVRLSLSEFDDHLSIVKYKGIFTSLAPDDIKIDKITVKSPLAVKRLGELLAKTSKESLQSFLVWRAIWNLRETISAPAFKPYQRSPDDRSDVCLIHVRKALRWILYRFIVKASYSREKGTLLSEMMAHIQDEFIANVHAQHWITITTKLRHIAKIKLLQLNVGYPAPPGSKFDLSDPVAVGAYYKKQDMTDSYFDNVVNYRKAEVRRLRAELTKSPERGDWHFIRDPDMSNAYYRLNTNEIYVTSGLMHKPLLDPMLPSYVNYGTIGSVLGHELAHALGTLGRHHNEHGGHEDYWDNKTVVEFEKRTRCFVDLYNNLTDKGLHGTMRVNGERTLEENLADHGGVNAAYYAWRKHRGKVTLGLPGLDMFTPEQLFFVFYGQTECHSMSTQRLTELHAADSHASNSARLEGMTRTSRGFREAFNCPVKQPVCTLW